jgi:hypothetical protein
MYMDNLNKKRRNLDEFNYSTEFDDLFEETNLVDSMGRGLWDKKDKNN